MNNLKQKHKDYLIKNEIKDLTDLVNYVEILRNTSNLKGEDRQMLFDFAFLITNEQLSLKSFFAENKIDYTTTPSKEFYNAFKQTTSSPTFMDEVINELQEKETEKIHKSICEHFKIETHTEVPEFKAYNYLDFQLPKHSTLEEKNKAIEESFKRNQEVLIGNNSPFRTVEGTERQGEFATMEEMFSKAGKKESQTVKKAPIFTFCKQMKNAVEKLALRSLYGHEKYEKGDDWSNFARVPNADFEYSNSQFRHALEIGGEETEEEHLTASAWNAISRLEIYLRNKVK